MEGGITGVVGSSLAARPRPPRRDPQAAAVLMHNHRQTAVEQRRIFSSRCVINTAPDAVDSAGSRSGSVFLVNARGAK